MTVRWHVPVWGVVGLGLVMLVGCDNRLTRVPVSGRVVIDGQPVEHGSIRLIPEKERSASGQLGPDGRFTLSTYELGDGAHVGTHKVVVLGNQLLSPSAQRWHTPPIYAEIETTDVEVTIDGPTDDLLINLTWAGHPPGKPWDERVGGDEPAP